ncbi:hypothetical protein OEZ86_000206 [Tetradesmus obliquus]|nr:hypothetical protein OEZ86_000206 [Tetradesmus obliquus]
MLLVGLLATAISCEAASAGQQHRKMLQWGNNRNRNSNLNANTLRAQASTSQAITEAVNNGGSLSATRRAGYVGSSGSWAVTQGNRVFNVVDWQNTWGGKRKQ